MRKIFVLLGILALSSAVFGQLKYDSYQNERFGYSISYPKLLIPQGEADNGDGQVFKNQDAELRVFGSHLLLHETLRRGYNVILREKGKRITYKAITKSFFAISGIENGQVFYQKTVINASGSFITIQFRYNTSKRSIYDKATAKIVKSLEI